MQPYTLSVHHRRLHLVSPQVSFAEANWRPKLPVPLVVLVCNNPRIAQNSLYDNLADQLQVDLREIENKAKEYSNAALLRFYVEELDQYKTAVKYIDHAFSI